MGRLKAAPTSFNLAQPCILIPDSSSVALTDVFEDLAPRHP
jgi:hypothetical protein